MRYPRTTISKEEEYEFSENGTSDERRTDASAESGTVGTVSVSAWIDKSGTALGYQQYESFTDRSVSDAEGRNASEKCSAGIRFFIS
jgi:hypothetical protein